MIQPTSPIQEANSIEKMVQFIKQAVESDPKAIWVLLDVAVDVNCSMY